MQTALPPQLLPADDAPGMLLRPLLDAPQPLPPAWRRLAAAALHVPHGLCTGPHRHDGGCTWGSTGGRYL